MLRGSIGDHLLAIRLEKDLKSDEDEALAGQCVSKSMQGAMAIAIDPECAGLGVFNTLLHEIAHACEYVYGFDIPHSTVYVMASGICQALISTGLVLPEEFEARFRRLMLESERTESK